MDNKAVWTSTHWLLLDVLCPVCVWTKAISRLIAKKFLILQAEQSQLCLNIVSTLNTAIENHQM